MLTSFFFFNDTATTEIYTLSLHDALPISTDALFGSSLRRMERLIPVLAIVASVALGIRAGWTVDRKSTRLNSSHQIISYAVFCLKKKKKEVLIPPLFCYSTPHRVLAHISH